jgi:hypothetical protein
MVAAGRILAKTMLEVDGMNRLIRDSMKARIKTLVKLNRHRFVFGSMVLNPIAKGTTS